MNGRISVKRNYQVRANSTYEHITFELGISQIPGDVLMNPEIMGKLWLLSTLRLDGAFAEYIRNSPVMGNYNLANELEVAQFAEDVQTMKEETYEGLQKAMASLKEEKEQDGFTGLRAPE